MKTVIIEDEQFAALRLENLIHACDPAIEVLARLESVEDSVEWLSKHDPPDLIFLDIHLEDGISFSIFEKVRLNVPIIFTTAFDEYAIQAFKLKSVDYLLKPISQEALCKAIEKYRDWTSVKAQSPDLVALFDMIRKKERNYRDRFSVVVGEKLKTIETRNISYFFSTAGITFVVMNDKHQYSLDVSLEKLSDEVDPQQFFRINRQYLVSHQALVNVHIYPKSRLKIELAPPVKEDVFVSIDKVVDFKQWMDGKIG